jgi:hypothetical protein
VSLRLSSCDSVALVCGQSFHPKSNNRVAYHQVADRTSKVARAWHALAKHEKALDLKPGCLQEDSIVAFEVPCCDVQNKRLDTHNQVGMLIAESCNTGSLERTSGTIRSQFYTHIHLLVQTYVHASIQSFVCHSGACEVSWPMQLCRHVCHYLKRLAYANVH